jgi:hydroxymethylbilane synthase
VSFSTKNVTVASRGSLLARAQVEEVLLELQIVHPDVYFQMTYVNTTGDLDLTTSLRSLEKTDFFTKEIEEMQLQGQCRLSIHSAKDLPASLQTGLVVVALTRGVNPADALVLPQGKTVADLPEGARIGTSSLRREAVIKEMRADFVCCDIRGTIESRLEQLDRGDFDGVVVAEAALLRLKVKRPRLLFPGQSAPLQGQLAIVALEDDEECKQLFKCIDVRAYENMSLCGNRP